MSRKRRPLAALAPIAVAALITACGSSAPAGTGSANSASSANSTSRTDGSSTASNASNGADTNATKREKAVKFAECVRAHGVPHFPDPDASGNFNFGVDVSAATFTAAVNACTALQPPGSLSGKRSPLQQSAALRFAQCVRAHGVPDFPDPVNGDRKSSWLNGSSGTEQPTRPWPCCMQWALTVSVVLKPVVLSHPAPAM